MTERRLTRAFFARSALEVAPDLLGVTLRVGDCAVVLCEVEAYLETDPASHSFRGPTARNASMFGPPGRAYVYRCYGIHWCLNVVTGPLGSGEAVLLRGGVVTHGEHLMRERRPKATTTRSLTNGPGKLTAALGIDGTVDGTDLLGGSSPVRLVGVVGAMSFAATPRIGVSVARDVPWRFISMAMDQ